MGPTGGATCIQPVLNEVGALVWDRECTANLLHGVANQISAPLWHLRQKPQHCIQASLRPRIFMVDVEAQIWREFDLRAKGRIYNLFSWADDNFVKAPYVPRGASIAGHCP